MRFAFPIILTIFGSARLASAICCCYVDSALVPLATPSCADVPELPTRAVYCRTAANTKGCETHCVSCINMILVFGKYLLTSTYRIEGGSAI